MLPAVLRPGIRLFRGRGGRDRGLLGQREGKGSPWVSRKVLGPLGQELCGPPQLLQAGAGCDASLELFLLTGGPGSAQGGGGQSGPGKKDSSQDLPTCPVQWFEFCAPLQGAWVLLWKAGATTAKGPRVPGPSQDPSLPRLPPHVPHLPDPWVP